MRKRLLFWLVPLMGYGVLWLIFLTNKKRYLGTPLSDDSKPVVTVFWHEHILMAPYCWRFLRQNRPDAKVFAMISEHKDGEYIARLVEHMGIEAARGSSTRGGARALIEALRRIQQGWDAGITPDGPRGPRHSVAPGVVALAQKSGCHIVAMRYTATRYWRLKSWDRFMVPKPFGTITLEVGEPFSVEKMEYDAAKELIAARLGAPEN